MILANVELQRAIDEGRLVVDPQPSPRRPDSSGGECPYQTTSVDLRLGREVMVYRDQMLPLQVDLRRGGFAALGASIMEPVAISDSQPFVLQPQRFVLAKTLERVELPLQAESGRSLAARVEGKSSYARCGLLVHFTAPTIHAGFEGTITLEIINLGRYAISLHPGMPICQLIVEEVLGAPFRRDSQFQGQMRLVGR